MALEVLHLILCERVESDPSNYHRLNTFGLITSIRSSAAPPFPVRHAKMRALIVWSGGQGAGELELQIVDEISAKAVFRSRPRRVDLSEILLRWVALCSSFRIVYSLIKVYIGWKSFSQVR
jgi:hypothetical protein